MYVTFKIALNIKLMSLTSHVYTYCMLAQVYILNLARFTYSKYSFNKCLEL